MSKIPEGRYILQLVYTNPVNLTGLYATDLKGPGYPIFLKPGAEVDIDTQAVRNPIGFTACYTTYNLSIAVVYISSEAFAGENRKWNCRPRHLQDHQTRAEHCYTRFCNRPMASSWSRPCTSNMVVQPCGGAQRATQCLCVGCALFTFNRELTCASAVLDQPTTCTTLFPNLPLMEMRF